MNTMLFAALQAILKALVGAMNYESVKTLVKQIDSMELSGDEKRSAVIQEARLLGLVVGSALLNFGD